MRVAWRSLLVCVVVCAGSGLMSVMLASGASSPGAEVQRSRPFSGSPFVASGALPPFGEEREQEWSASEPSGSSPDAVARREASRTLFANLTSRQAVSEARAAFGGTIEGVGGVGPRLQAGQRSRALE